MSIERGAPLFMHPQHRTRLQPESLVITERLHPLFNLFWRNRVASL